MEYCSRKKNERIWTSSNVSRKLVERVLKLFSFENDIILDPFNGVGTTTKVAKELNRNYIGIDTSKEYNKKAKEKN